MARSCLGGDHDTVGQQSGFGNHNWIRSFSERVRGRRSGEWEEGIGVIRRRRLAGVAVNQREHLGSSSHNVLQDLHGRDTGQEHRSSERVTGRWGKQHASVKLEVVKHAVVSTLSGRDWREGERSPGWVTVSLVHLCISSHMGAFSACADTVARRTRCL
ncbi:hypothetical protein BaRGS_00012256 [Batillaria attramentaria]|uniref:Uncharacterized protein n=1 Tax=Batillaria attramentaria TaxID=370345 RepID=A0ABD0LAX4_9CAEN